MKSAKYHPILISQLMQEYNESIIEKNENKLGFIDKSINNIKTVYNNIYKNINVKLYTSYTHKDLYKEKHLTFIEFKIKEYGICLGNLITNLIVDSVDNYNNLIK